LVNIGIFSKGQIVANIWFNPDKREIKNSGSVDFYFDLLGIVAIGLYLWDFYPE
jgi:hypothetical protein